MAKDVKVDGSPTFEKIKARGSLIIGVKEDQPGLGFKDPTTNKYSGFDIDIAKLIAAKLGFDPETRSSSRRSSRPAREQAIINGDVDYYVGTYTINDDRKEKVSFAGPYFVAGQDLLVKKDNTDITGKDTLKGKKVCSVTGSTPTKKRAGREADRAGRTSSSSRATRSASTKLLNGEVDAVTTDDAILKGYAAAEPDKLKVVGQTVLQRSRTASACAKDDKALRDKVNDDPARPRSTDGTWQKIYDGTLGKSGSPTASTRRSSGTDVPRGRWTRTAGPPAVP